MPGVCIEVGSEYERGQSALTDLWTPAHYSRETVVSADGTYVGYTSHSGYPVTVSKTDTHLIYLEGELYDRPDGQRLRSLADSLLDPGADGLESLLQSTDGEFLLVAIDRQTGDLAVVNDLLARLPVYYLPTDDGVLIAREPGFLLKRAESIAFDQMGLAQTLLFRYTLGDRTIWRDVRRLQPATRLLVRGDGELTSEQHHQFDFSRRQHRDRSVAQNATALVDRFKDACRRRSRPEEQNVISLSGGLDSRAVAAGLGATDTTVRAATFVRDAGSPTGESRVAEQVANALDLPWDSHAIPPMGPERMGELLRLKEGLTLLSLGFLLAFFEQLAAEHGRTMTYFTGDGGDKTLPDLSPTVAFTDERAFSEYLISKNAVVPLEDVTDLVDPTASAIHDEIASVVGGYPESDWVDRYIHFLVHERAINWLFEGEDRNRCYFWSTTPFYDVDFFRYAMNVPDEQKARYGLYREFLQELWPPATRFEHVDFGQSLDSPLYGIIQHGLRLVDGHPWAEALVKRVAAESTNSSDVTAADALLRHQLQNGEALTQTFSEPALERLTSNSGSYSPTQLYTLLTLTSAVERYRGDGSQLNGATRPLSISDV